MTCSNTSLCCCGTSSCPEVSEVTITDVVIELAGIASYFKVDSTRASTLTLTGSRLSALLSSSPISQANVTVEIGGVPQVNGVDFTLSGDVVTFTSAVPAGMDVTARYLSTVPGTAVGTEPVGMIQSRGAGPLPGGWLSANGAAISRTTYATLFAVYGTTYGIGDGSTTFNLPSCSWTVTTGGVISTLPAIVKAY
jgi:hypothetical protein